MQNKVEVIMDADKIKADGKRCVQHNRKTQASYIR